MAEAYMKFLCERYHEIDIICKRKFTHSMNDIAFSTAFLTPFPLLFVFDESVHNSSDRIKFSIKKTKSKTKPKSVHLSKIRNISLIEKAKVVAPNRNQIWRKPVIVMALNNIVLIPIHSSLYKGQFIK